MTVLLIHSEDSAVGMYRIWMPGKYLPKTGISVRRLPNESANLPNDREIGRTTKNKEMRKTFKKYGSWEDMAEGADLVVLQRSDNPQAIPLALAIREQYDIPLVYEIDDNIYDVSKNSPAYQYWFPGSPLKDIAELFMRNVDAITVSTENLVDVYKQFNDNIYVLPNCQDPEAWKRIKRRGGNDKIVIGWAGGYTHYDDLKVIARPIKRILRNYPNVEFRIMGTLPDFLDKVDGVKFRTDGVHCTQWPKKLAELNFDIGLAPIVERPFNAGKSNIKWQEYAMLEIPTVASNFGPYKSIEHGVDGLLANNNEYSWELQITKLIEDEELRRRLGEAAKQSVLANYNIEKNIGQWHDAYSSIIRRFKSEPRKENLATTADLTGDAQSRS